MLKGEKHFKTWWSKWWNSRETNKTLYYLWVYTPKERTKRACQKVQHTLTWTTVSQ